MLTDQFSRKKRADDITSVSFFHSANGDKSNMHVKVEAQSVRTKIPILQNRRASIDTLQGRDTPEFMTATPHSTPQDMLPTLPGNITLLNEPVYD